MKWCLYASELFLSPIYSLSFCSFFAPFVCSLLLGKSCAGCHQRFAPVKRTENVLMRARRLNQHQCCWECAQRAVDRFEFGVNAWWVYHRRQSPLNWICSIVHRTIPVSTASTYFQIHCKLKQHCAHFAKHQLLKHNLRSYKNLKKMLIDCFSCS